MSPARITEARNQDGSISFKVVYRRGGRAYRQETAGTFRGWPGGKTTAGHPAPSVGAARKEASLRRDLVGGWLAAGKDPRVELAQSLSPHRRKQLADVFDSWALSRHDVGEKRQRHYRAARESALEFFGAARDPLTITVADCREYVGWLAERYKPGTVRSYYQPLAMALDFIDVEPNPARHRSVKMPRISREEPIVMSGSQFRALIAAFPERYRLFFRTLEATGMRIGELAALQWGDVDFADNRFRVSVARTKGRSGGQRWVQVPAPLMDELHGLVPFDERRPEKRVFASVQAWAAAKAMTRACEVAGIPHFSPHSLRHRRLSLWHMQGVPAVELARRAGHTKPAMTLSVYSHVMVDAKDDEWA